MLGLILEGTEFTFDGQAVLFCGFYITAYLGVDMELGSQVYEGFGCFGIGKYFEALAHIEHLVHFFPIGACRFLDHPENRRCSQQVVFHDP